ncbi:MAG: hypothetical protein RIR70_581 [Pseudomonadota bacterium]|jgi:predicted nucleotidyltransferase
MRLRPEQLESITRLVKHWLGEDAVIWLFGSRLDDARRGGDIDLYIEIADHELMRAMRCKVELQDALDLPVDLIVRKPDDASPIANIAKSTGIRL